MSIEPLELSQAAPGRMVQVDQSLEALNMTPLYGRAAPTGCLACGGSRMRVRRPLHLTTGPGAAWLSLRSSVDMVEGLQ